MTDILSLKEELRDTLDKGERAELVKKVQRLAGAIEGLEAVRVRAENKKYKGER